ncbi:ABC transporter permease [bacterium]|nr:MAG: ABC transporter permease [bacterium]QQR61482.1 MAG: ABC transporter permease [bacterium]QQR62991.1 MAG: ABC transporter permease [bacterium]
MNQKLEELILSIVTSIGHSFFRLCFWAGTFFMFLFQTLTTLGTKRLQYSKVLYQMNRIGVESFNIIILTGMFAGMVFALQTYIGFQRVGGEQFIGAVVALGMIRELGPVLGGLMVTGRACSAIAAEIGTMRITEQLDALTTLRIDPFQYLIVPRLVAGTVIMPFLTIFSMIFGIIGGYVVCVYVLQLSPEDYQSSILTYVEMTDITSGLIKAAFFGFILAWVGCFKGFYTRGGAYGVGVATTESVVQSSIMILIANYFLTKILEHL